VRVSTKKQTLVLNTHTHIRIYIYIYVYVCIRAHIFTHPCICECTSGQIHEPRGIPFSGRHTVCLRQRPVGDMAGVCSEERGVCSAGRGGDRCVRVYKCMHVFVLSVLKQPTLHHATHYTILYTTSHYTLAHISLTWRRNTHISRCRDYKWLCLERE
jgi:hypothetical protein